MPEEVLEAAETGIWAENVPALAAFLSIGSQMRWIAPGLGAARAIGLDYQGARAGLDLAGVAVTPALWADIRVIEGAAVAALNGRAM